MSVNDLLVVRVLFVLLLTSASFFLLPFGLPRPFSALAGLVLGLIIIAFEMRVKEVSLKRLIGAAAGSVLGILGAFLMSLVLGRALPQNATTIPFLQIGLMLWMTYVGLVVGASKGDVLNLAALGGIFGSEKASKSSFKILDTSVIIDGRIADICDTGFMEGTFIIPQFILQELQHIADSSDPLKRGRGRRGLDVLNRIQKQSNLEVKIVDQDYPKIQEVDAKLIALAKDIQAKIVTNDFNLNKVAELQGIPVLNINQLFNALKPVVLPGEVMNVKILKEGKEPGQGVAYLDDGTMVVVDNARRYMGKTVDVTVTSVLQTTAGRMIFTILKEDAPENFYSGPNH
jgi:uncharacterized protein YacL